MRLPKGKQILSMIMAFMMVLTTVSWTGIGAVETEAADNAPNVTYTFEQMKELSNIPVMNLVMAEPGNYNTLKTDKSVKQNIAEFELVNTNGKGSDIYLTATVEEESGETIYPLTAKGRGNSSWTMPTGKKPYNIKFDKKQDILGMGKAKSWCLISNWVDTTYMRNFMAYMLACQMGLGTPDCEMVALCINGTFEGIYLITEKVGLNDYRTEIPEGENDGDKNGDGIVTEIIVEADIRADEYNEPGRFRSDNNVSYVPKDPEAEDLSAAELEEIKKELNAMEAAVMSGANYEDYIDVDSWVDVYIINELAKNPDFGFGHQNCYASTYLYFREGGKVFAGPVWDFDIAFGRNDYSEMESEGYRDIAGTTGYLSKATKYYKELFENTDFEERVIKRWKEIRETLIPNWMSTVFEQGYNSVKELNPIDLEIWGNHSGRVAGTYDMGRDPLAFENEVAYVKNFINERVAWLDEQWNVDQVTKKFSGSWIRQDVVAAQNYDSYEEMNIAANAGEVKTEVEDIWDGGYGGKEKNDTEVVVKGSQQTVIPGVALEKPFTITMERQMGQYDWSSDTTHAYDIWKDGEASQGFGGVKYSINVTESGRYVGLTTASYYIGDTTATMSKDNVQVYVIDVGTDGSVTLHDGTVALSYEARTASTTNTTYGNIEKTSDGYKVTYKANGKGNAGTTIGGTGKKQFSIFLPEECISSNEQTGVLNIISRPDGTSYPDVLLKQDITYIQAAGERPVSWSVDGDAVLFEEGTQKVTAVKAGEAVITATAAGGLTSSVTIQVKETVADSIEYDADATLGKYFGNTEEVVLKASEAEKGSWATVTPGSLTRFRFSYKMTQEEADHVVGFTWQTKNGDQIIGGPADYYVFVNGNPLFAATSDGLDYAIAGFDDSNIIQITDTELPEYLYAYMNGKAGSTKDSLDMMKQYVVAGENEIDIFVYTEDGGATVLPYLSGTTKIENSESEPIIPEVPEEPETTEPEEPETTEPEEPETTEPEEPETTEPEEPETTEPEEPETTEPEEPETPEVEYEMDFALDGDHISIEDLSAITIGIEFTPSDIPNKNVSWISSDETVVTVDENGVVLAHKPGTVQVTATSEYNNKTATVTIEVVPTDVKVTIEGADQIEETGEVELTAALDKQVVDGSVKWSIVSGEKYARLDGNLLKGLEPGTVVVKATSVYNESCYATKSITVTKMNYEFDLVLAGDTVSMKDLSSITIGTNFTPSNVPNKNVTWTSSDKSVVSINANGIITAHKPGTVQVTATSEYGNKKAVVTINVTPADLVVTINNENEMTVGDTITLDASVNKAVYDTGVNWSVISGTSLVKLTGNTLKALAAGKVTVKAVSKYNKDCFATKEIIISEPAVEEGTVMVPGTPLAKPIVISMEKQMGQYEWSANTTHAYDMWEDGKATQGFGQVKMEMTITKAGRYVGLTSASYYVGDTTVQMGKNDTQVYVIDVANDGSVTVYDGKLKINYAERTTTVVDTNYAKVEPTSNGYKLTYKSNGTGNTGVRVTR